MSTKVEYSSRSYKALITCVGDPLGPELKFTFSHELEDLYIRVSKNPAKQLIFGSASRNELRQDLWVELSLIADPKSTAANIYIPSGRAFFTEEGRTISALQNPNLDSVTRQFSGRIAWDTKWKIGLLTTGRREVQWIEKEMERIARGVVIVSDGRPTFISLDGRTLPLGFLSSGTQEMLPMFNVINYTAFQQEHIFARASSRNISPSADVIDHNPILFLEEPEANVFPETQYDLAKLFARLANDHVFSFKWVITTHSPCIMTAFNTLIEAARVGSMPGNHERVNSFIPEQYWIQESDFKAYAIEDGVLISIFKPEAEDPAGEGMINGDYLDGVSNQLGKEFDRLLDIEFAN